MDQAARQRQVHLWFLPLIERRRNGKGIGSLGVNQSESATAFLGHADASLYRAKARGRNRVVDAAELPSRHLPRGPPPSAASVSAANFGRDIRL
ncbi:hypothetical protein [Caballeronia grimmiae]|uniref:hypothetical protein n=1 Tax=Caballeronia grimmiae TaxID=1071679 RepID=UPI0038B7DEC5